MATAMKLPHMQNTINIPIAPGGTISNQGYLWVADNTSITWSNSSPTEFDIVVTIGGSQTIRVPARSTSASISASGSAINYVVQQNGRQVAGPYCIQWGNGALQVSVSANSAEFSIAVPTTTPSFTGNIQFLSDAEYQISWSANVWAPQPANIYPTPPGNPVQQARLGSNGPVSCSFSGLAKVPAKGTVHVGS